MEYTDVAGNIMTNIENSLSKGIAGPYASSIMLITTGDSMYVIIPPNIDIRIIKFFDFLNKLSNFNPFILANIGARLVGINPRSAAAAVDNVNAIE